MESPVKAPLVRVSGVVLAQDERRFRRIEEIRNAVRSPTTVSNASGENSLSADVRLIRPSTNHDATLCSRPRVTFSTDVRAGVSFERLMIANSRI